MRLLLWQHAEAWQSRVHELDGTRITAATLTSTCDAHPAREHIIALTRACRSSCKKRMRAFSVSHQKKTACTPRARCNARVLGLLDQKCWSAARIHRYRKATICMRRRVAWRMEYVGTGRLPHTCDMTLVRQAHYWSPHLLRHIIYTIVVACTAGGMHDI